MRQHKGVTLVETCVALAILVILLAAAVPSMRQLLDRRALRGEADALRTDLYWLRATAVGRGQLLHMAFSSEGSGCYVVYAGSRGDCRCGVAEEASCVAGAEALKLVRLDPAGAIRLQSNVADLHVDPTHGAVTPAATLSLVGTGQEEIRQVVSPVGRVRTCSPGRRVPGLMDCA